MDESRTIAGVTTVYLEAEGAVRAECQLGRGRCGRRGARPVPAAFRPPAVPRRWTVDKCDRT